MVQKNQKQQAIATLKATKYEGPLPHPETLMQYEEVVPGGAERIFQAFERQSDHRMKLEKKVINGDSNRAYVGLIFGFILSLLLIGGGIFLAYNNKTIEGLSSIAIAVSALLYSNRVNKRRKSEELDRKR